MADDADMASASEELFRETALGRYRWLPRVKSLSTTCHTCGGDIEPKRLEVLPGAVNCIECALDAAEEKLRVL